MVMPFRRKSYKGWEKNMLRIARREDVPEMLAIYGPYVLRSTATFEYEVPSLEEFYRRYDTFTRQFPWLVWEENGVIGGYAYASAPYSRPAYAWCAEPTVYLRPEVRGKGVGTRLYRALEAILKKQGYQIIYALVCEENETSQRFHEKLGYEKRAFFPNCGCKFGRWMGLYWMEKRLSEVKTPNEFPIPWPSIVQSAESEGDFLDDLSLSK